MDKININNLFPAKNKNNNGTLNVTTLYQTNKSDKTSPIKLSIDELINERDIKKNKAVVYYEKTYNMALKKIKDINRINSTTDIIYDVVEAKYGCREYDPLECLNYIEERLRGTYYMDTLKLSNKSLFISWKNIEDNRKTIGEAK